MTRKPGESDQTLLKEIGLDAKDLEAVTGKLKSYILPEPKPLATQQLIDSLVPHLAKPQEEGFRNRLLQQKPGYSLIFLARLGFVLIGPTALPFWWLMTTVVLMGVAWLSVSGAGLYAWSPLLIVIPLLAIATTSWFFRPRERALADIEATCPVGPRQLALAQLLATLVCLTLLALPVTALVSFYDSTSPLVSLLFGWLAPMLVFTALTLHVSLYAGGLAGMATGAAIWSVYAISFFGDWLLLAPPQSGEQWLTTSLLISLALLTIIYSGIRMRAERRQFNA